MVAENTKFLGYSAQECDEWYLVSGEWRNVYAQVLFSKYHSPLTVHQNYSLTPNDRWA